MRPAHFIPLILMMGLGCHSTTKSQAPAPIPPAPTPLNELPAAKITPFEPDYKTLPQLDAKFANPGERKPPRGIEEATVITFAAGRSTTANLLEKENEL